MLNLLVDNVLIIQRRKSTRRIFEDAPRERDRQVLLCQAQEIVSEIFIDKHRLLWDRVLQQAEIGTAAQPVAYVLKILKVRLEDILSM